MSKLLIGYVKYGFQNIIHRDLSDFLRYSQDNKIFIKRGKFDYAICDLEFTNEYIFGWLLKLSPSTKEQYFDYNQWTRIEEEIEKRHVSIGNRFIIFKDNIIIFEDNSPYLAYSIFRKTFFDILSESSQGAIYRFDIILKKDVKKINEFLLRADKITKITFKDIEIPNPIKIGKPNFERAEEFINETLTKRMVLENDDGINVDAPVISGGLGFTERGWWDAKLVSLSKKKKETFDTVKTLLIRYEKIDSDSDFIEKTKKLKEKEVND